MTGFSLFFLLDKFPKRNYNKKGSKNMASIKIDLSRIAPKVAKQIDEINKKAQELKDLARELSFSLDYSEIECDCKLDETSEKDK